MVVARPRLATDRSFPGRARRAGYPCLVRMAFPASRVVSLVPSLTETICDASPGGSSPSRGSGIRPRTSSALLRVGGTKNPDREKIAALQPDLVLVNGEENRREDIDWFGARFELHESMPRSVPDAAGVVKELDGSSVSKMPPR